MVKTQLKNTVQKAQALPVSGKPYSCLNYLLYVPHDYHEQLHYPLVMFLHGLDERGNQLDDVRRHGIPKRIDEGQDFPFIAVSPQCPDQTIWSLELDVLHQLFEHIKASFRVDHNRVYLTGLSMGGFGTWHFATRYPNYLAAIMPVCGGLLPFKSLDQEKQNLVNLPVWTFHGEVDDVVPGQCTAEIVDYLRQLGSQVKYTVYPGVKHDSWTETYRNPDIYTWLLSQRKSDV